MHDGIVHLIEWRNLKRDGFALSIFYLDTGGTVDDTMLRMQQIVSTQTAHAQWLVGWLVHPFIKGGTLDEAHPEGIKQLPLFYSDDDLI